MYRKEWMLRKEDAIGRSLTPSQTGGAPEGTRGAKRASLLLTCVVAVGLLLSGAALICLNDGAEPVDESQKIEDQGTDPPWNVCGFVFAADGVTPVGFAVVTVTNLDSLASAVVISYDYGMYEYDMNTLGTLDGHRILVEAVSPDGLWSGSIEGVADKDSPIPYLWMDVTLDTPVGEIPEFPAMILPVVGVVALLVAIRRRRKT